MKNFIAASVTALIAAISSVLCARLQIPVWVMFIGWIAFVAGGMKVSAALPAFICSVLGVLLGFAGAAIISGAGGALGADLSLLVGVFVIVLAALLAQGLPFANLVICYFVGMTTFFASGLPIEMSTAGTLVAGLFAGVASGTLAVMASSWITQSRSEGTLAGETGNH